MSSYVTSDEKLTPNAVRLMLHGVSNPPCKPSSKSSSSSSSSKPRSCSSLLPFQVKLSTIKKTVFGNNNNNYNDDYLNSEEKNNLYNCYIHDGSNHIEKALVYIDPIDHHHNDIIIHHPTKRQPHQRQGGGGMNNLNTATNTQNSEQEVMVSNMIVWIHGYITSNANYMPRKNKQGIMLNTTPFLCITDFQVHSHCRDCPARTAASATTLPLSPSIESSSSSLEEDFLDDEDDDDGDGDDYHEDNNTIVSRLDAENFLSSSNHRNHMRLREVQHRQQIRQQVKQQRQRQQRRIKIPSPASIRSGTIGSFAEMYFPYVTDDDLLGKFSISATGFLTSGLHGGGGTSSISSMDGSGSHTITPLNEAYAQKIADFISHYRAKVMLLSSASLPSLASSSSSVAAKTSKEEGKDENNLSCASLATSNSVDDHSSTSTSTMRMCNNHENDTTTSSTTIQNNKKNNIIRNENGDTHLQHQRNHNKSNENHIKAVSTFAYAQLKKQSASLVSNTGKVDAKTSELLVKQYSMALSEAIEHATISSSSSSLLPSYSYSSSSSSSSSSQKKQQSQSQLTKEVLCQWHHTLGNNNIIPNAGQLRKRRVKAGPTTFMHHSIVEQELITFCHNLRSLEHRLFYGAPTGSPTASPMTMNNNSTYTLVDSHHNNMLRTRQFGYAPILFASVALFGIVDIHPFVDGNGRLARIVANWALQRGGLPFTINICATPTQRAEYVTAIELTRRNLNLKTVGSYRNGTCTTLNEMFTFIQQSAGLFQPMVHMIMDRVYRSVIQCQNVIQEHFARQLEEEEAAIARRYRENAAKGTCLICFDDHPNIATLCCGRAVHLNCLVEWLSTKSTCPICRGGLPSLSRRVFNDPSPASLDYAPNGDHIQEQEIEDGDSTLDFETYEHDEHDDTVSISEFYDGYDTTSYQPNRTETINDTTTIVEQNENGDFTTFIVVREEIHAEIHAEITTTVFDDTTTTIEVEDNTIDDCTEYIL